MKVSGSVTPPGDKSITHRALILGGLARSRLTLIRPLVAHDTRATAAALRQLGVSVSALREGASVTVVGASWRSPSRTIQCGNSGTTARLLLGAIAGRNVSARLTGDTSLRRRPMRRVTVPLRAMGAGVVEEAGDGLPLRIAGGGLRPLTYHTPVASAQVKAALLFAGLSGGVAVTVSEPLRSRDHSERLFEALGFRLHRQGTATVLEGPNPDWPRLDLEQVEVPGDPSSAAYLVGVAALAESGELMVHGVGVNPTRVGFLAVMGRMGCSITRVDERLAGREPVADLLVRPASLRNTTVVASEVPSLVDEVPLLAVLASRARGETRFCSVGELRVKESDRLRLIAENLRVVGVEAEVQGDDLVIVGTGAPPRGRVSTGGDHRLAMAFAVLGTVPGAAVELSERESVAVSYPRFFDDLRRIGCHG